MHSCHLSFVRNYRKNQALCRNQRMIFHRNDYFTPLKTKVLMLLYRVLLPLLIGIAFPATLFGQVPQPQNGVAPSVSTAFALKNATIIVSPEKTIEKGTLLIRDGKIVDVGVLVKIPDGYTTIDCSGKIILPGFIELYSTLGIPAAQGK